MENSDYEKPMLKDIKSVTHGVCQSGQFGHEFDPSCVTGSQATEDCDTGNQAQRSCISGSSPTVLPCQVGSLG